ncbi:MAG: D-tyrosyl-tRNA(Tyr) deacylase [Oscillospiraceae bacterium]|jgi:D-tyrosyl-tRNA(Tyr) deacylase|nr:D-tyrosyl-tRNA(Tyr) deacylase [Oscillospiraceae bacterium]
MRAVLTRVNSASVTIDGVVHGKIGKGFLVLLGVHEEDTEAEALKIADKICGLRIFEDENGKMNVNPHDANAELLIISQFTLFADCKSRRPGFSKAARPEKAVPLYELVIAKCREAGFRVETGVFAAEMLVDSQNDGPVTILLDTKEL